MNRLHSGVLQNLRPIFLLCLACLCVVVAGVPSVNLLAQGRGMQSAPSKDSLSKEDGPSSDNGFFLVTPGRQLSYPQDHGSHPEYPIEWWYSTGSFEAQGEQYGFQLTFFRVGVRPYSEQDNTEGSKWRAQGYFIGHFAVTNESTGGYCHQEVKRRDALGMAGATTEGLNVWIGEDRLRYTRDGLLEGTFSCEDIRLKLLLNPQKPLVLHGDKGYVRKGEEAGDASFYSSFTRMGVSGSIAKGQDSSTIDSGLAWYDHEIVSSPVQQKTTGWDWFSLQFESGDEFMWYRLRLPDGSISKYSRGTYVAADGTVHPIGGEECSGVRDKWWQSPETGVRYPVGWTLTCDSGPARGQYSVTTRVEAQEFNGGTTTGKRYWEGLVRAERRKDGSTVAGAGYMELVGYDAAM